MRELHCSSVRLPAVIATSILEILGRLSPRKRNVAEFDGKHITHIPHDFQQGYPAGLRRNLSEGDFCRCPNTRYEQARGASVYAAGSVVRKLGRPESRFIRVPEIVDHQCLVGEQ